MTPKTATAHEGIAFQAYLTPRNVYSVFSRAAIDSA